VVGPPDTSQALYERLDYHLSKQRLGAEEALGVGDVRPAQTRLAVSGLLR